MRFTVVIAGVLACMLAGPNGNIASPAAPKREGRITLLPHLSAGQEFNYRVRYRERRTIHAESRVAAPMAPQGADVDIIRTLQVVVREPSAGAGAPQTHLRVFVSDPNNAGPADAPAVEFALSAKGDVQDLSNLAALSPEEQVLWRAWVDRFTVPWSMPSGLRIGEKWLAEEAIENSVLAALSWQKEFRFVEQQKCPVLSSEILSSNPNHSPTCAVVFSDATLRQKSPAKDATPEDYKLHDLKTSGSARGKDQAISYIDMTSGVVARATDDSTQSMDVVIAKTDGSNRVRYTIQAESHTELVAVP